MSGKMSEKMSGKMLTLIRKCLYHNRGRTLKLTLMSLMLTTFIIRQINHKTTGSDTANNYGIDCNIVEKYIKEEIDDLPSSIGNPKIDIILFYKEGDTGTSDLVIRHRPLYNCLEADNPEMIKELQESFFIPPSSAPIKRSEEYIFESDFENNDQALDVYEMVYKNKVKNGFFIEAGAADCKGSVTLPFEDKLNWTGLLVEAVPTFFRGCLKKDRRATLINTCLGMKDKPHFIGFDMYSSGVIREVQGKSIGAMPGFAGKNPTHLVEVQCFPLYTLLAGMGNPTVHLFVLDIEGFELGVLRHIPWDKVDIQVFSIETDLAGHFMDGSREEIIQIMEGAGYVRFDHREEINRNTGKKQNDLFVRKDIVKKYNVVQL